MEVEQLTAERPLVVSAVRTFATNVTHRHFLEAESRVLTRPSGTGESV